MKIGRVEMQTEEGADNPRRELQARLFRHATLTVLGADDIKKGPNMDNLEGVSRRQAHRMKHGNYG